MKTNGKKQTLFNLQKKQEKTRRGRYTPLSSYGKGRIPFFSLFLSQLPPSSSSSSFFFIIILLPPPPPECLPVVYKFLLLLLLLLLHLLTLLPLSRCETFSLSPPSPARLAKLLRHTVPVHKAPPGSRDVVRRDASREGV